MGEETDPSINLLQQKVTSSLLQVFLLEKLSCLVECDSILLSQVSLQKFTSSG